MELSVCRIRVDPATARAVLDDVGLSVNHRGVFVDDWMDVPNRNDRFLFRLHVSVSVGIGGLQQSLLFDLPVRAAVGLHACQPWMVG